MAVVLLQLAPMQWHICKQYLATSIPIIIYVANDGKLHFKDYTYSPKECLDGCVHPPVAVVFLDLHKLHQSNYFLQYFFKMSWIRDTSPFVPSRHQYTKWVIETIQSVHNQFLNNKSCVETFFRLTLPYQFGEPHYKGSIMSLQLPPCRDPFY